MFGNAVPGQFPIKVYSMSLLSFVSPFGRIFRFLLTFPFVGSFCPVGSTGQLLGVMFTLGCGVLLRVPYLISCF